MNPKFRFAGRKLLSTDDLLAGIKEGNRSILGQAITLIESNASKDVQAANELVEKCLPLSGNSIRVGITGVPGVGKSTFIESFGKILADQGKKVAVLAVDPTSQQTSGSILGDKTRMEELSGHENAFIRPSPSDGSLGGVARKTRETILLCEAAGYEVILVETVGVGQSEIAVHSMVDYFLLLMLAGAGDELQGIKRGIMEMADSIAITKADTGNLEKARLARMEYKRALHLFPPSKKKWTPNVNVISSVKNENIDLIWEDITNYTDQMKQSGWLSDNRANQAHYWLTESIKEQLGNSFYNHPTIQNEIPVFEDKVKKGEISPYKAADQLMEIYFRTK